MPLPTTIEPGTAGNTEDNNGATASSSSTSDPSKLGNDANKNSNDQQQWHNKIWNNSGSWSSSYASSDGDSSPSGSSNYSAAAANYNNLNSPSWAGWFNATNAQGGSSSQMNDQHISDPLYPIAILIDELRHDDLELRKKAVGSLTTIAEALGPERTRDELVPFLASEVLDDDDDVLIALSEQLGRFVKYVGGINHGQCLLHPLEELANTEEAIVRGKATAALKTIALQMSPDQINRFYIPLIHRLAGYYRKLWRHDWFTSRISSTSIFGPVIKVLKSDTNSSTKVETMNQIDDLWAFYRRLCGDDTPMVRRAAANVLHEFASVLPERIDDVLDQLKSTADDDQDSVRILTIPQCVHVCAQLSKPDSTPGVQYKTNVLDVLKGCKSDKSWRVRYMLADRIGQICEAYQAQNQIQDVIKEIYLDILNDTESEVRAVAVSKLEDVFNQITTEEHKQTLELICPKLQNLVKDASLSVRVSLAGSLLHLAPIVGQELSVDFLIKICLELIRDEQVEVRLRLISTLPELSQVVGLNMLSQSLLPAMSELATDRQWRVRLAILEQASLLAEVLGAEQFSAKDTGFLDKVICWLGDPVYMVREAATENIKKLCKVFGSAWAEEHLLPHIQPVMIQHMNYLLRVTALTCIGKFIESDRFSQQQMEEKLMPLILERSDSEVEAVPNVRFYIAKMLPNISKHLSQEYIQKNLIPVVERLRKDPDSDVKHFARLAAESMSVN